MRRRRAGRRGQRAGAPTTSRWSSSTSRSGRGDRRRRVQGQAAGAGAAGSESRRAVLDRRRPSRGGADSRGNGRRSLRRPGEPGGLGSATGRRGTRRPRRTTALAPGVQLFGFGDEQSTLAEQGPRSDKFFDAGVSVPVSRSTSRCPGAGTAELGQRSLRGGRREHARGGRRLGSPGASRPGHRVDPADRRRAGGRLLVLRWTPRATGW